MDIKNLKSLNIASGIFCYDDRVAIVNSMERAQHPNQYIRIEAYVCVLCLTGSARLCVGDEYFDISAGDMLMCHPHLVLADSRISGDFTFRCLAFSPEYAKELSRYSFNTWDVIQFLENNPVLHLQPEEVHLLCQYCDLLMTKFQADQTDHYKEIIDGLLQLFIYEFGDILQRCGSFAPRSYSSAEALFRKFLGRLTCEYPRPRSVSYYAERLCVTPKYLSAVCKELSGQTALALIHQQTIKDIRTLLLKQDKSIKEIANELNFSTLSFFGKYVREHLGMSPRQFREQALKNPDKD
jgi:AraC-like DNA-binding protein